MTRGLPPRRRGFTLVECAAACAVAAVLALVALPSYRGDALRAARLDAVQALTRLQAAQEVHRTHFGRYATELSALHGVAPVSEQGRYTLSLAAADGQAYSATAQARGVQAQDSRCPALTLQVNAGFAQPGPTPQCWNR